MSKRGESDGTVRNAHLHALQHEAKRRCRLEIDDKRELGGLLDRQVGGLLDLKNPASINAG
jgi:hypothetical protein